MPRKYQKHTIKGKTVKQVASEQGVCIETIYLWIRKGTLDAHLNGTHVNGRSGQPKRVVFGKTYKEWAKELGLNVETVRHYAQNVYLERLIKAHKEGKTRPTARGRIVYGKNLTEWSKQLGITREYVRQLADNGKLIDKINQHKERQ